MGVAKGAGSPSARAPPPPAPAYVRRNRQEGVFPENLFSRSPGILPPLSVHASSFYEAASFPGSPLPLPFLSLSRTQRFYLFVYNTSPIPRMPFICKHLTVSVTGGRAAARGGRAEPSPLCFIQDGPGQRCWSQRSLCLPGPAAFLLSAAEAGSLHLAGPQSAGLEGSWHGLKCISCVRQGCQLCRHVAEKQTFPSEAHPMGPALEASSPLLGLASPLAGDNVSEGDNESSPSSSLATLMLWVLPPDTNCCPWLLFKGL